MLRFFLPSQAKLLVAHTHVRSFSTTCLRLSQDITPTTDDATAEQPTLEGAEEGEQEQKEPIKLSRRRRRFHEWANGPGSRFARPAEGTTNYLGETPFPNNPLFQPRPPLSDAKREEVYQLYMSDSEAWTIRRLAVKFGYSLKRIEAILKLKANEKEMEASGIPLQRHFAKSMEQYMGADQPVAHLHEPLIDIFPDVSKPRFKFVEEDATFTAKDAADVLNRKEYQILEKRAIDREESKFVSKANTQTSSPAITGKKFVIVDTSRQ